MVSVLLAGRGGFALLVVVVAIGVMEALVSAGYFVAAQQFRAGVGGRQRTAAFYAAEAGLAAALHDWDPGLALKVEPGSSRRLAEAGLSSGDRYSVRLTRLDPGAQPGAAYLLILSEGRAGGAWGGRRRVALLLCAHESETLVPGLLRGPKLVLLHPLAQFAWLEIL